MDKQILKKFVRYLGEKVSGKWIMIGGCVLPLLEASDRYTKDIDIVGPLKATNEDTLTLIHIAQTLGLPIETINQSASFFLYKIENWEEEIILIHQGSKASVYRPSATLYILLKLGRFNETDYEDCLKMFEYAKKKKEKIDLKRIENAIGIALKKSGNHLQIKRLKDFLAFFKS